MYYTDTKVCKIIYREINETNFEYIFEPLYKNIDALENFKGIQGIDLSLRKKQYVRRNMMPSFIFEHNPLPGKKIFNKSVKIQGKCLLEYLATCGKLYFGDKLYIKPL